MEENWRAVQSDIDTCKVCRSENLFERVNHLPGRPCNPGHRGRLLFISEAPPVLGGFWKEEIEDDLRKNLLTLLKKTGFEFPVDVYSQKALETFLWHGFFLVQTLKWPFAQGKRKKRPSFNDLGPAQQRGLIEHSVDAHLWRELDLIAPSGILALGKAAWCACVKLSQRPLPSQKGSFETLVERREDYQLMHPNGLIPLNVTYLAVKRNMNQQARARAIEEVLKRFLERTRTDVI